MFDGSLRILLLAPQAGAGIETAGASARDSEGVIANVLGQAGANAVILRPDRYVLAFIGREEIVAGLPDLRRILAVMREGGQKTS